MPRPAPPRVTRGSVRDVWGQFVKDVLGLNKPRKDGPPKISLRTSGRRCGRYGPATRPSPELHESRINVDEVNRIFVICKFEFCPSVVFIFI